MTTTPGSQDTVADRLAITDLVNMYADLIDAKDWDGLDQFFTEDVRVQMTADLLLQGRDEVVGYMRNMLGTDEIETYHHVASFTPEIDGDRARADVRIRAMHNGVGPRAGTFYESLSRQAHTFARRPEGWRCDYYEWRIVVKLGSLEQLFAPEYAAMAAGGGTR